MKKINREDIEFLLEKIKDPIVRTELTQKNHFLFFHIYFGSYVTYQMAPFHREIFAITEDEKNPLSIICAFRGSGKSTLMTLSYALWSILGVQKKKYVVLISQTQEQARQHFKNLKRELEGNNLLKTDLGPFEQDNEWNSTSLVLTKYNARITCASTETSIRGLRHMSHRPDLIICDDLEDLNSAKTRESRNKTYNWFTNEILPLGDIGIKVIVIGNLLHEDSLIMRLKQDIEDGERNGIFRKYPLLDEDGKCLWPGKYPNNEAIEAERLKIGDKFAWAREFLLKILDDREAVIDKSWIHYYDELPKTNNNNETEYFAIGVDLAASQKESADFTAMVSAKVIERDDGSSTIYILPNPVNERIQFPKITNRIKMLTNSFGGRYSTYIFVEEVALQVYLIQYLDDDNFIVEGLKIYGMDKRTRLNFTTHPIQSGKVLFPKKGAEPLIEQLLHFGVEKHDDMVDAFTVLILKIKEKENKPEPNITFI
jgi:phage terminase large subunit-like protein